MDESFGRDAKDREELFEEVREGYAELFKGKRKRPLLRSVQQHKRQTSRIQASILIWKHQIKATHPFQEYILEKDPSKVQPKQGKTIGAIAQQKLEESV